MKKLTVLLAAGLLAALPVIANAGGSTCPDFTGDANVTTADILFVIDHYQQPKGDGTNYAVGDLLAASDLFAQSLKEEIKLLPSPTVLGEGSQGGFSYWTMLNGVTRFADHGRKVQVGKRDAAEARFESNMLGSNAGFKERAARELLSLAGVAKV